MKNENKIYSMMFGSYSTDTNRFYIAEIDFTARSILFRRYLPSSVGTTGIALGYIVSESLFFMVEKDLL
jgi:hypothetical protein